MPRRRTPPTKSILVQFGAALWLGLAIALVALLLINLTAGAVFSGRVYPGVSSSGLPLAGLKLSQATALITVTPGYPEIGSLTLVYGDKKWVATPAQLGVFTDPQATADIAYKTGRSGSLVKVLLDRSKLLRGGIDIPPSFLYSENIAVSYLENIATEINQPLREASLELSGTNVIVNDGQPGRVLDIPSTLSAITAQIQMMQDATIPLVVLETQPVVLDASAQGELARELLSKPFRFTLPADLNAGTKEWQLEPDALAEMLMFERVLNDRSGELVLVVDEPRVSAYLESLRTETDAVAENARFIFNDETSQLDLLTPAIIGKNLNTARTIENLNASLKEGKHEANLAFDITEPGATDNKTGAELGITELVFAYTSYFRGSSADRVQNIKTASASFHGLLIPPGGILSMSDELGDISLDNGYAEALIIHGGQTITGVGGGVCQVSTTLFRTVYFGGYQILERYAHAYRVGYYEQTAGGYDQNLAGLDATVFVPLVDFKFKNDSAHWLLMETYVNSDYSLTWKFYSTSDGRKVESNTTGPTKVIEAPDPLYRENPELAQGTVKQVDWAAEGATVVVNRTVTRDGVVLYNDTITTVYQPWRAVYEYGPGTEGMPPEKKEE